MRIKILFFLFLPIFFSSSKIINTDLSKKESLFQLGQKPIEAILLINSPKNNFNSIHNWQKNKKGLFVYEHLKNTAEESQKDIISWLYNNQISYESLHIINLIKVKTTLSNLDLLAKREDVKKIIPNYAMHNLDVLDKQTLDMRGPPLLEWGIEKIGADKVWELGITGEGAVIGAQDTGVNWEHSTLKSKYRGFDVQNGLVDHNYNWHDAIHEINPLNEDTLINENTNPCGLDLRFPCDDGFHGTWTMGISLGADENNSIGVAPDAKWIAARNMDRGWGTLYTYLESFQWFLAPTDLNNENPDPTKAPHVINNSWSCPTEEGCSPELFPILEEAIENLISAGVAVVVAGGNSGRDGCHTVDAPSAIYENAITVGASTIDDDVAPYSSRGPVIVDNSFRIKPNIIAPGSSVRSASKGQEFLTGSGTSAASPHVSGTIALMISANPELAGKVNLIRQIIIDTAVPLDDEVDCGPFNNNSLPNNTYGFGRLNAYAAVLTAINLEAYIQNQQFAIYPNPFYNQLKVNLPIEKIANNIMIWNVNGQLVQNIPIEVQVDENQLNISTEQYHSGIYFYQIIGGDWKQSGKLIKH